MKLHLSLSILLFAATTLTIGCTSKPTVSLQTPAGFAVLPEQTEYLYRAVNASGVVLAVRAEDNKPFANLEFWADALDSQLQQASYKPDGKAEDVKSTSGIPGRRLRYIRENEGRKYRYWVTVYVTESRVFCVEAGGDEERFKGKALESLQRASDSAIFG